LARFRIGIDAWDKSGAGHTNGVEFSQRHRTMIPNEPGAA
jgi:hypothetical protein